MSQAWFRARRTAGWVRRWGWLHLRRRGLVRIDDAEQRVRWVMRAQQFAMRRHRPKLFAGSMTLLATDERLDRYGTTFGWERFVAGPIDVVEVPGEHSQLFNAGNEATTSAALDGCFRRISCPDA